VIGRKRTRKGRERKQVSKNLLRNEGPLFAVRSSEAEKIIRERGVAKETRFGGVGKKKREF